MSITVNVQEAKTRLSELLRRVEAGDSVVIARAGAAIARIEAVSPRIRDLSAPLLPEIPPMNADIFLEPMSEEDLSDWEDLAPNDPLAETAA